MVVVQHVQHFRGLEGEKERTVPEFGAHKRLRRLRENRTRASFSFCAYLCVTLASFLHFDMGMHRNGPMISICMKNESTYIRRKPADESALKLVHTLSMSLCHLALNTIWDKVQLTRVIPLPATRHAVLLRQSYKTYCMHRKASGTSLRSTVIRMTWSVNVMTVFGMNCTNERNKSESPRGWVRWVYNIRTHIRIYRT